MQALKAIETTYRGYRFRSRAEARYAVAFDAMKVPWSYEVEGFEVANGDWYLPDFWLPKAPAFVEIKGDPADVNSELMKLLAMQSRRNVWVLFPFDGQSFSRSAVAAFRAYHYSPSGDENRKAWPGFLFGAQAALHGVQSIDLLAIGLRAARAARFEHGESGMVG